MVEETRFCKQIEATALTLGATKAAIRKWRLRGIPSSWQLKLFQAPGNRFSINDLQNFPHLSCTQQNAQTTRDDLVRLSSEPEPVT
jgi:hypothetical protein